MTTTRRLPSLVPSVLALLAAALGGCSAPGGPGAAFDGVAVPDPPEISPEMRTAASDLDSFAWFQDFPEDTARAVAARPGAVGGRFAYAVNFGVPFVTPEAYPDADEVSLFDWEDSRYRTNGTYTTTWTSLSKILTQRGLEDNRTFSFSNDDFYGSTTVLVARIHTPGAPPRDVDLASNLAEAIDTGSLASNIHDPNEKTFTLAFPGLQVGDAVELKMRRTIRRPRCEGVYADYLTFESDHPILFQGARIEGPASMPLRSRAFRDAGPVRLGHAAVTNEAAGTIAEAWVAEDETPRFFAEPHMPPAYDCTARLLLSTAPDWESLSRWYARLCAPHLAATNDAMRAKVDELLRTALSAPPAAGSDRLLDDSRAKSAEAEAADRRAFRELNPDFRLDELDELWFQLARCRVEEARLREDLLSLSGTALDPDETLAKARQAVKCAEDAENEEDPLPARVQSLSESERDAFLENVWVERLTEIRRLEEAIGTLKERIQIVCHSWPRDDEFEEEARPRAQREAVVRALFDFVSREVRYMGAMAESEAPGYEPHDVSLTFDNRYGVCRDKAALLVAMLRMAGIDAWPVLINVGPRKDAEVPQPYFNHAIVAADSGDPADPYLLMDPTSETTRSLLPEYLCEMSYLVARDEGETIRETPPLPVEENMLRAETVYALRDDATADVTTTLSFAGVNDAAYRGYFASIPRDSLRAFFERVLQGVPGAVLTGWEVRPAPEQLRTSPEPLFAKIDYTVASAARRVGFAGSALFDVPALPAGLAIASRVVGDLGLEKRRFPLDTDYPCGYEETVEILLPEGVEIEPRPDVRHEAPGVRFEDVATNAPSGGPGRYRALKLLRSRYEPEQYGSLRLLREAEERTDRVADAAAWVPHAIPDHRFRWGAAPLSNVLARAVEPAPTDDLYTEFSRTTVDVSGAPAEWTVETTTRRRILTYAGQRKAGDLTFRWNPATSDFEVVDARVIAPDGTETPVNPALDLFTGDQEWVADAPRYPAGKLATVSFPKLAPGMSVQWTTRRRAHDRDLFSFSETLGSLGSFGEISVTVAGTNDLARAFRVEAPFWKTVADRFPVETNETDGATTFLVRGGGPGSQIVSEPNMPPLHRLAPVLRASSQDANARARAVAERMWELSDPAVQTNAAALARTLVPDGESAPGGADPERAFVAIRDWCAINLREAGPAYWDLPLSALSPADATLAARYGHEADLRILQLALVRAAGVFADPEIRLYNADWDGALRRVYAPDGGSWHRDADRAYASPSTFDTIALALRRDFPRSENGARWAYLFLDGATQYAHPFGDRNQDRAGLRWRRSWDGLPKLPLAAPERPSATVGDELRAADDGTVARYDVEVRTNGSARVRVEIEHGGSDFEAFRKRYEQILPEERRRDAQRRAASLSQSARLVGEVVTETPPRGPCILRFEAEVPDFAQPAGRGLSFRPPGSLPVSPAMARRRFPYRRAGTASERTECAIRLPEGWTPCFGWNLSIGAGGPETGGGAGRETEFRDGVLTLKAERRLERIEFDPSLYEGFLARSLFLRGPDADTIRIVPPSPPSGDGDDIPVSVLGDPPEP